MPNPRADIARKLANQEQLPNAEHAYGHIVSNTLYVESVEHPSKNIRVAPDVGGRMPSLNQNERQVVGSCLIPAVQPLTNLQREDPTLIDSDCNRIQKWLKSRPSSRTLMRALKNDAGIIECLVTHQHLQHAPVVNALPRVTLDLRVFGLNFFGANIEGSQIIGGQLRGVNFTGTKASFTFWREITFIGCYFHGADFDNSSFKDCHFIGCEISKNNFCYTRFFGTDFDKCDIYANWAFHQLEIPAELIGDELFGVGEKAPWDLGFCEGHETEN